MLWHGFTPSGFNISTIIPIPKNKRKSASDTSNYRAIALSSPLAKLFDWLLIIKYGNKFLTSDFQFGFKPSSSTTECTFSLSETVNYFSPNVYVMLLDCSKAFDKVNYVKLFSLLHSRGLNPMVLRCLIHLYTNQHLNVSWNHCSSKYFSVANGVKQGGVLSPMLFSVYINDLLCRLESSPFGCKIGHIYSGVFAYADDVALVAPSLPVLSKMCEEKKNTREVFAVRIRNALIN